MKHKPLHNGDLRAMERDPKLRLYRKYLRRLERYVEEGTFWRFSAQKRKTLVNRLKRLWNQLNSWRVPLGKLAVGSALLAALGMGNAQGQTLTFVEQVGAANPIDSVFSGYFAAPGFVDIDDDGDFDAFVGSVDYGSTIGIRFFKNVGSSTNPIMVEQDSINNPLSTASLDYVGTPNFIDIDDDGDEDVFFGTVVPYGGPPIRFFENTGTASAATFVEQFGVNNPFNSVAAFFAFPTFMDLDNDGDFDAFVGEYDITTYAANMNYYENIGTNTSPNFSLQTGANNPLSVITGGYVYWPNATDVDNDGDYDVFVTDYSPTGASFRFFENSGSATSPTYTEVLGTANPFDGVTFGYYGPIADFVDIDADGDQDVFMGDYDAYVVFDSKIRYFENTTNFTPVPINPGEVVLNEFLSLNFNNVQDQDGENDAWIELYNNTGNEINLGASFLSDDVNDPTKWALPQVNIPANEFLMIWADGDTAQAGIHSSFELQSIPGFLSLANEDSSIIDSVSFGEQYIDITTGRDPNGTGAFTYMPPTFADTNSVFSISPGMLTINEFQADNESTIADQDGEFDDWIELHNNTGIDLDLSGLFLSDDATDPTKWQFPDTTIASNDFLIIWADEDSTQTGLHTSFGLAAGGEDLVLSYPEGTILDATTFAQQFRDLSTSRIPNGNGPFDITPATFSDTNDVFTLRPGDVVINEFMANNVSTQADSAGEFDDWIELFNNSSDPVDLTGVFLSNDAGNSTLFQLPNTTMAAGEYLIVWADMDDAQAGIHANFTLDENTGGVLKMSYPKASLDSAIYSAQNADESFGRFVNGTGPFNFMPPTFAAENTFFTDLEGDLGHVGISLYPNPTKDKLILDFSEPIEISVQLVNVVGQELMNWETKMNPQLEMNVSAIPAGIYFLRIGKGITKRLVIQK